MQTSTSSPAVLGGTLRSSLISLLPLGAFFAFLALYAILLHGFKLDQNPTELVGDASLRYPPVPTGTVEPAVGSLTASDYLNDVIRRTVWANFSLALGLSLLTSIGISIVTLVKTLRPFPAPTRWSLASALGLVGGIIWPLAFCFPMSGGMGRILYDLAILKSDPELDPATIMNWTLACSVLAIWLVVAACCALNLLASRLEGEEARQVSRLLKLNLVATAVFLCLGILQTFSLYNWLGSFIPMPEVRELVVGGMTFSVSFFYTVLFVATFLPTYLIWRFRAECWAQQNKAEGESVAAFLHEHGIAFSPRNWINLASVLSSPLLVGILVEVFETLSR